MKTCSIMWVGFKSGVKWIAGDSSKNASGAQSDELQKLQETFEQLNKDVSDGWDQKTYNELATKFLEKHGYQVIFSDYGSALDEDMSEKEADEFVKKLRTSDEVKFKYKKIDGSTRTARGTLKKDLLPKQGDVEKAKKKHHIPDSVIVYWDLDKEMFRCFKKKLFIGIIED